jgi:DNA (cytosine-5)-methyltransferase 1
MLTVNLVYYVKFQILNTCKITKVPQNRERIYIVCFTDKKLFNKFNFDFPEVKCDPIKNFLEQNIPDKYYYDDRFSVYDSIKKEITTVNENVIYQYRRYYVRENKNKICPTLTANMGSGGHNVPLLRDNKGIRKLTPRECFNLQGFPSNYLLPNISDSGLYKLAGNAVSIPVIELVINKILRLFNDPI